MSIINTLNQKIKQNSSSASVMISKIGNLLKDSLLIALAPENIKTYEDIIKNAFTNLNVQSNENWIIWKGISETKTTYQYNIFLSIQNQNTGYVILILPIALTIAVNLKINELLFIDFDSVHDYTVDIKAIEVVEQLI